MAYSRQQLRALITTNHSHAHFASLISTIRRKYAARHFRMISLHSHIINDLIVIVVINLLLL